MNISRISRFALFGLLVALQSLLTACGGGKKEGSGPVGSDPNSTTVLSISLELRDAQNERVTHLVTGQTATAKATVRQTVTTNGPNGSFTSTRLAPNVAVHFATNGGAFTPASGDVLTDGDGDARIQFVAGNAAGAFQLNASAAALNTTGASAQIAYSIDRTLEPSLVITIRDPQGTVTGSLRAGEVYTVEAVATRVLTDITQPGSPGTAAPAPGVLVTFATDGGTFDPTNGQVLTNAAGIASVRFRASLLNGGFTMAATATIADAPVSAGIAYQLALPNLVIGSGEPWQPGVLTIQPGRIQAGGNAIVRGFVRDVAGSLFVPAVPVTLTTACSRQGAATISTPVLTASGEIFARYVAGAGCYGTDVIRAELLLEGATVPVTAQASIVIDPPIGSGIQFESAEPEAIVVQGRGGPDSPESSVVTFIVTTPAGLPVPGASVRFALTTSVGTASLSPLVSTSGFDGRVSTTLVAGRVPGTTTVLATVESTGAQTQSAPITISNGRPTQRAFSLSAASLNIEAANIDGVTDSVQMRLADRNGNPAPDGSQIRFTAGGGSITPSCVTTGGGCSALFTSQAPRPSNGRVAILATSIGDESFTDLNGNGLYDQGEPFEDLPEAWRDDNENGRFDAGEPFVDDDLDGRWSTGNTRFDGADCASGCGRAAATLRASGVIVLSTSSASIGFSPEDFRIDPGATRSVLIAVSDLNGNMMAGGTTIAITTTNGTFIGEASYTVADTNARGPFLIRGYVTASTTVGAGGISVKVTSPSGVVSNGFTGFRIAECESPCTTGAQPVGKVEVVPTVIEVDPGRSEQRLGIVAMHADVYGSAAGGREVHLDCPDSPGALRVERSGVRYVTSEHGTSSAMLAIESGPYAGSAIRCRVSVGAASTDVIVRQRDPN